MLAVLDRAQNENGCYDLEYRFQRKDGSHAWLHDRGVVRRDSTGAPGRLIGVLRDISGRKSSEASIKRARDELLSRFTALAESVHVILYEFSVPKMRFTFVSQKATEILGYPVSSWYAPSFLEGVIHPDDVVWVPQWCFKKMQTYDDYDFEYRCLGADGSVIWFQDAVHIERNESGEPDIVRGCLIDITRRKQDEQALSEAHNELERRVEKRTAELAKANTERQKTERQIAELALRERQRFGQLLHDSLGQQISATGMVSTMLREQLLATSSPLAEVAERLDEMVLLSKAHVRSLSKGLQPVDVDANGLAVALQELVEETRGVHQVECGFDCSGALAIEDNYTATQLYLIAREAVHNAIKHANANSIKVRLVRDDQLTLEIADDGVGLDGGCSENSEGMGLRIMRHRAELLNATLTIDSFDQKGTVIRCSVRILNRS